MVRDFPPLYRGVLTGFSQVCVQGERVFEPNQNFWFVLYSGAIKLIINPRSSEA